MLFVPCPKSHSSFLFLRPAHPIPKKTRPNFRGLGFLQAVSRLSRPEVPLHCFLFKVSLPQTAQLVFFLSVSVPSRLRAPLCLSETDTRIKGEKKSRPRRALERAPVMSRALPAPLPLLMEIPCQSLQTCPSLLQARFTQAARCLPHE